MKKILIWLLALAGGFVVLLIAAVLVIPRLIDIQSYLPRIEKRITEATGRQVSLGKDFDVSIFPWVGVSFNDLRMGNPEKYGGGNFIKIKSFEARVKLMPLLSKNIEVNTFVLEGPEIELVRLADGSVNWTMAEKSPGQADAEAKKDQTTPRRNGEGADFSLGSLNVDQFKITNGRILYKDEARNLTREIDGITLQLDDVSLEKPMDLFFQANLEGKPVTVEGSVGPIGKAPGQGIIKIDLVVNALQELKANLKGELINPATEQKFMLILQADTFSPRRLLEALKMPLALETGDPTVLGKMALDLHVQGDPAGISVQDSTVILDDSTLRINAVLKDMAKPDVAVEVTVDAINIDRYLPPAAAEKQGRPEKGASLPQSETGASAPSSKAPAEAAPQAEPAGIDYEPLRQLVIEGTVNVGELIVHGAKLEKIAIKLVGRDGIFDLDPLRLDLYQGTVELVGKFNVQQDRPEGLGELKATNVMVGPLLKDSMQKDILEGTMGAAAKIGFSGDNATDIKKSLNGSGNVMFVDGAIVGLDIAEIGRTLAAGAGYQQPKEKPRTDFAELQVLFVLEDGVFRTRDSSLLSPLLRVQATGSADLVDETLDMSVRPKIVGTLKGQGDSAERSGLTVPIRIEGTFAEPRYSADLSGLVDRETIEEAIKDPEAAKQKMKSLEETGKSLLEGFGLRKKK